MSYLTTDGSISAPLWLQKNKVRFIWSQGSHLFQSELKLCRVQQQLEQSLWVVLGVVQNLVFDLAKALVVWVVGFKEQIRI